jgi:D-glycero-D-manno-heptose 1,7-bisphosphate phosphatase
MINQDVVINLAPSIKVVPALCLDFDGTIRRSKSGQTFIQNFQDIELMPGIEKIIWRYRNMGWLIFGISNQGGVAHGFKLPVEVENEMDATLKLFERNPFHIVKFCYHDGKGKISPFNYRSLLRKPDIGMLALMEAEAYNAGHIVDWDKSLFVGDRSEDEQCAKNAGIRFRHIDSFLNEPHEFKIETTELTLPATLSEAVEYLMPRFDGMEKYFEKDEDGFAAFCHSQLSGGIGMKIRNEFGFWKEDTEIYNHMKSVHNLSHPDDMSDKIIREVYKKFNKK